MAPPPAVALPVEPHAPLVLWTRDSVPKTGFACLPIYCETPGCTCRIVRLLAIAIDERFEDLRLRAPGELVLEYRDGSREAVGPRTLQVRAAVDLDSGTVDRDALARSRAGSAASLAALRALVDAPAIESLRQRLAAFEAEQARDEELSRAEGWQGGDWTSWDGGEIDWREVRPEAPADVYTEAGIEYEARELYCADLDCECADVTVLFAPLSEGAPDGVVGEASVHGPSGQLVGTRSVPGSHDLLMRLWTAFASRRDLSELDARRKRVIEIAPRVQEAQERQLREQDRVRRDIGRNDPCPCGSGKKYKRCCI